MTVGKKEEDLGLLSSNLRQYYNLSISMVNLMNIWMVYIYICTMVKFDSNLGVYLVLTKSTRPVRCINQMMILIDNQDFLLARPPTSCDLFAIWQIDKIVLQTVNLMLWQFDYDLTMGNTTVY